MSSGENAHSPIKAPIKPPVKVPVIGIICGLLGGTAFGLITPLSPLANEAGSSPLAITIIRFVLGTALMALILSGMGITFQVPRDKWLPLFFMGLFIFTVTVFYLSAVVYIPVSLAAILFYTYPVIVTVTDPLLQRRLPSLVQVGLSLLAFIGITIAMGPSLKGLDWRGLVYVALAALSISSTLILSRQVVSHVNSLSIVFYVNLVALVLSGPYFLLTQGLFIEGPFSPSSVINAFEQEFLPVFQMGFPTGSQTGLYYAVIIAGLYLLATLAQISTVRFVGPARTAMFFNIEPVVTILAAVIILNESLTTNQMIGALCVLGAVIISCYRPVRV